MEICRKNTATGSTRQSLPALHADSRSSIQRPAGQLARATMRRQVPVVITTGPASSAGLPARGCPPIRPSHPRRHSCGVRQWHTRWNPPCSRTTRSSGDRRHAPHGGASAVESARSCGFCRRLALPHFPFHPWSRLVYRRTRAPMTPRLYTTRGPVVNLAVPTKISLVRPGACVGAPRLTSPAPISLLYETRAGASVCINLLQKANLSLEGIDCRLR